MAFDPHYIAAFNIEDVLLDKDTGQPLTGGIVTFEQANQPGVKKDIFQITYTAPTYNYIPLPNPMTLSSIGTFEDSLGNPVIPYFYPYNNELEPEYYRVVVQSSELVEQFVRDPVPSIPDAGSSSISSAFENEVSNPQFSEVLFDTSTASYVYSFTAASLEVVNIAPDWDIIVSSAAAATVTVSQITPTGSTNIPTNPGTILNIQSAGLNRFRLRQRFYGSPNLWGNGNLAASFVARTYSGTSPTLTLYYNQSNGSVTAEELVAATLNSEYTVFSGNVSLPVSTSTEDFPDAYIEIEFDIPLSIEIDITSVMLAATGSVAVASITYSQDSENRQIDHLFHYYQPQLNFKPIPSLLAGWDFPLNPAQFLGTSVTMNTTPAYIWDQTIGQSVVGNVAVIRNTVTGGFQASTANANEAFMLIQYLSGEQARKMLGTKLSVNVSAFRTQAGGAVTCKVNLYRGSAAAVIPTLPLLIGSLAANGTFTKNDTVNQGLNWTQIDRSFLGNEPSGSLSVVSTADYTTLNDDIDLGFSDWEITESTEIADTDKFAIVVSFSCPTTGTVVTVNSISVVPGRIPTRPAPQTIEECLLDCSYYYQKSFRPGITPANNVGFGNGEVFGFQAKSAATATQNALPVNFPFPVRIAPTVTLYNPAAIGTAGQIYNSTIATSWSNCSAGVSPAPTTKGFLPVGDIVLLFSAAGDLISMNWTADARLGIL